MTLTLHYTRPLLKQAIRAYLKHVYLNRMIGPCLMAVLLIVACYFYESPWLQAFALVPLILIPTSFGLGYWLRIRQSLSRLALLHNGEITLTVDEKGVTTESAVGHATLKWLMFSELWEFPALYLLIYNEAQFITLPKNQITPELIALIRQYLPAPAKT